MKYLTGIIFIYLLTCLDSSSQSSLCNCNLDNENEIISDGNLTAKVYISPYLNKKELYYNSWGIGDVELVDGSIVKNKILRYNGYLDELVWLRDDDKKAGLVDKQLVKSFKISHNDNTTTDFFRKIKIKRWFSFDTSIVYMHVLAEGKLSLYVSRKIIQMSNSLDFIPKYEYYLYKDSNFIVFKPNRFNLLKNMNSEKGTVNCNKKDTVIYSEKETMKLILRKNHLKVRNENQLIKSIDIFNKSYPY
jgi:hypothetical protein